MKKLLITFTAMFMMALSASAMSYEQARQQALFLTDKMAYELNLTEEQYEAAYEINLDYLMSVNHYNDLYGVYWEHRNLDLSYILLDWQYRAFLNASYFYRPLYWRDGFWHFGIYARYPYRDYYYFGMPRFYAVYRGGHSWHHNGGRSWYHGRDWHHNDRGHGHSGMRDGFQRGDYGQGNRGMEPSRHGQPGAASNGRFGQNGHSNNRTDMSNGVQGRGHSTGVTTPAGTRSMGNSNQQSHEQVTSGGHFGGSRAGSSSVRIGRESSTRTTVNNPPATRQSSSSSRPSTSMSRSSSSVSRPSASRSSSSVARSSASMSRPSASSSSISHSSPSSSRSSASHSSGSRGGGSHSSGGHFGGRR